MQKVSGNFAGRRRSNGFTLLELVVVVAVIGVLAAVAAPRLLGVGTDARNAALDAVAKTTSSLSAANYSARQAGGTGAAGTVSVAACIAGTTALWGLSEWALDADKYTTTKPTHGTADQGTDPTINTPVTCYLYSKTKPAHERAFVLYTTD